MNIKKVCSFGVFLVLCIPSLFSSSIHPRGYWVGEDVAHAFDAILADALTDFFQKEQAESVVDFGCGMGDYAKVLLHAGIFTEAYDGNPDTPKLTGGIGNVQDLSIPVYLGKQFDWVLSLEVGEHLPQEYERIFIENLVRHCRKGIVLSWAVKNQGGHGHFNEQNNDYIKQIFSSYGFINDVTSENILRAHSHLPWFKNTIMIFRK